MNDLVGDAIRPVIKLVPVRRPSPGGFTLDDFAIDTADWPSTAPPPQESWPTPGNASRPPPLPADSCSRASVGLRHLPQRTGRLLHFELRDSTEQAVADLLSLT
ncbi:hypothetical protein GCM10017673_29190 [Streptosporangium violaceochromogenes]|nr:hypothetical protein GCM10017673_29190 [Streptosporangium violaceochromogenes]